MRFLRGFTAISLLILGSASLAAAEPPMETSKGNTCFFATQFDNWKAPDPKTVFIRLTDNRYFRLDLSAPCYALKSPGAYLISRFRGPNTICSAVDWDLKVNTPHGIPEACIVRTMTPLTPQEVSGIPKKFKP